jgi:hypothetical protein
VNDDSNWERPFPFRQDKHACELKITVVEGHFRVLDFGQSGTDKGCPGFTFKDKGN